MKRNWIRSSIALLLFTAPLGAIAQEPPAAAPLVPSNIAPVNIAPANVVPGDIFIPAPLIAPAVDPTAETFALASGDILTRRPAEPTSPSDSLNSPLQSAPATFTFQAAAPTARDGFEERIARLEAQVAALSQQLKSGVAVANAPRAATMRTLNVTPTFRTTQASPAIPTPPAAVTLRTSRNPVATATVAQGAPIVIHVYVHPGPAHAAAAAAPSVFYYQATPAMAAPADPTRVRARVAVPAVAAPAATPRAYSVPLTPGVPPTPATPALPALPAIPAVPGVQLTPAVPAPPGLPAASPVLPTLPVPPSSTTEGPALTPASRIAWDDLPSEELAGERQPN